MRKGSEPFCIAFSQRRVNGQMVRATGIAIVLVSLAGCGAGEPAPEVAEAELPYADEYPAVGYATREPAGVLGQLAAGIAEGSARLEFDAERGYLDAVLEALGIDASSQVLVFSRTSLQTRFIRPNTPRAIYFNDESYVAWVPGAPTLEIASYDPALGPVFYTIPQEPAGASGMERRLGACLRCHDTYSLSGGGVPRFLIGSGYTGTEGELVSHEAWILTTQATPLRSRWGGWYVTGRHGDQPHLGNIVVQRPEDLQDLESLRTGNIDELDAFLDTSSYLTDSSDIVALMVLEHQIQVLNLISRLRYEADAPGGTPIDGHVEALVRAMLFIDEVELTDTISGSSGFREHLEGLGPFDSEGRSLRQLDLTTRLFRYPLSFLIYADAFQALPAAARLAVYSRLREILASAPAQDGFDSLPVADRAAIIGILRETLPEVLAD